MPVDNRVSILNQKEVPPSSSTGGNDLPNYWQAAQDCYWSTRGGGRGGHTCTWGWGLTLLFARLPSSSPSPTTIWPPLQIVIPPLPRSLSYHAMAPIRNLRFYPLPPYRPTLFTYGGEFLSILLIHRCIFGIICPYAPGRSTNDLIQTRTCYYRHKGKAR